MADCPLVTSTALPSVHLPGGVELRATPLSSAPTAFEVVRSLTAQIASALPPVAAIFKLVAALVAVKDALDAVPATLASFPPEPGRMLEALETVGDKVGDLSTLVPAFALPVLVRDICDLLLLNCDAIDAELTVLEQFLVNGESSRAVAEGLADSAAKTTLTEVADCVEAQVEAQITALATSNAAVDGMTGVLNTLSTAVGLPEIPVLGDLGTDVAAARASVATFRTVVESVRGALTGF